MQKGAVLRIDGGHWDPSMRVVRAVWDSVEMGRWEAGADDLPEVANQSMPKPLVGVIGSRYLINGRFAAQLIGEKNLRAVADVTDALPLMFGGASDNHRSRAAAGHGRRDAACGRAGQRSSNPLQHRTTSKPRTLRSGPR